MRPSPGVPQAGGRAEQRDRRLAVPPVTSVRVPAGMRAERFATSTRAVVRRAQRELLVRESLAGLVDLDLRARLASQPLDPLARAR